MALELFIMFIFCMFLYRVMNETINSDENVESAKIIKIKMYFTSFIIMLTIYQMIRLVVLTMPIKVTGLFYKYWTKADFLKENYPAFKEKNIENQIINYNKTPTQPSKFLIFEYLFIIYC